MLNTRCVRLAASLLWPSLRRNKVEAITLLEMLITLAVGAILLGMGMPSIAGWLRGMDVRSSAGELMGALQTARTEAIARNREIRVSLGDAQGRAVWSIACVNVSATCPARLRGSDTPGARQVRWGASTSATSIMTARTAPLLPGQSLPGQVTFNALGAAPATGSGTDVARIDVLHPADAGKHRLVVFISVRGALSLCDPAAAAGQPRYCG